MATVDCPACHRPTQTHDSYGTESYVCSHCHGIVSLGAGRPRLLATQDDRAVALLRDAPLEVGRRGTLRGKHVEVSGVQRRGDGADSWFECAIADEAGVVTWLWVDAGHFSLCVAEGRDVVTLGPDRVYRYAGHALRLYSRATATVLAAAGEFPYEVDVADHPQITDYIAPPYVASFENRVWWVFEYVPLAEIEEAFGITCDKPADIGVNQPAPRASERRSLGILTVLALGALLGLHALFAGSGGGATPLLDEALDLTQPAQAAPQSFGPVHLPRAWNAIDIEVHAPVNNAWADLTLALVNEQTGRSYWTSRGVEFYQGRDSDGAWSEGSQTRSAVVRSLPGGNYRLLAHGDTGTWNGGAPPSYARIFIYERPAPVSNLLLAIGLIVLVVAVGVYRDARFEAARWEGSRFKPTGGKK